MERVLPLDDRADLDAAVRTRLERALAGFGSLADVIAWGVRQVPEALVVDVIVQDEFSHDVVVAWGGHHLVFDTT